MAEKRPREDTSETTETSKKQKDDVGDAWISLKIPGMKQLFHVAVNHHAFSAWTNVFGKQPTGSFDGRPTLHTHNINSVSEVSSYAQAIGQLCEYLMAKDKDNRTEIPLCITPDVIPSLVSILIGLDCLFLIDDTYKPINETISEQTLFWRQHTHLLAQAFVEHKVNIEELFVHNANTKPLMVFLGDLIDALVKGSVDSTNLLSRLCVNHRLGMYTGMAIGKHYIDTNMPVPVFGKGKDLMANIGLSLEYFTALDLHKVLSSNMNMYICLMAVDEIVGTHIMKSNWGEGQYRICSGADHVGAVFVESQHRKAFNWNGYLAYEIATVFPHVFLVKFLKCDKCHLRSAYWLTQDHKPVCGACHDVIKYTM